MLCISCKQLTAAAGAQAAVCTATGEKVDVLQAEIDSLAKQYGGTKVRVIQSSVKSINPLVPSWFDNVEYWCRQDCCCATVIHRLAWCYPPSSHTQAHASQHNVVLHPPAPSGPRSELLGQSK